MIPFIEGSSAHCPSDNRRSQGWFPSSGLGSGAIGTSLKERDETFGALSDEASENSDETDRSRVSGFAALQCFQPAQFNGAQSCETSDAEAQYPSVPSMDPTQAVVSPVVV